MIGFICQITPMYHTRILYNNDMLSYNNYNIKNNQSIKYLYPHHKFPVAIGHAIHYFSSQKKKKKRKKKRHY